MTRFSLIRPVLVRSAQCLTALVLSTMALTGPSFADGDATEGESNFKKCKACHAIVADDGTEIQKGGKTGPNLFGIIGRVVGSTDFKYSDGLKAVGESGLVWDEAELVTYLADPSAWVKDKSGDAAAKSKMTFKLTKDADDMAAYLASLGQ